MSISSVTNRSTSAPKSPSPSREKETSPAATEPTTGPAEASTPASKEASESRESADLTPIQREMNDPEPPTVLAEEGEDFEQQLSEHWASERDEAQAELDMVDEPRSVFADPGADFEERMAQQVSEEAEAATARLEADEYGDSPFGEEARRSDLVASTRSVEEAIAARELIDELSPQGLHHYYKEGADDSVFSDARSIALSTRRRAADEALAELGEHKEDLTIEELSVAHSAISQYYGEGTGERDPVTLRPTGNPLDSPLHQADREYNKFSPGFYQDAEIKATRTLEDVWNAREFIADAAPDALATYQDGPNSLPTMDALANSVRNRRFAGEAVLEEVMSHPGLTIAERRAAIDQALIYQGHRPGQVDPVTLEKLAPDHSLYHQFGPEMLQDQQFNKVIHEEIPGILPQQTPVDGEVQAWLDNAALEVYGVGGFARAV